jgi:hypothetical protein
MTAKPSPKPSQADLARKAAALKADAPEPQRPETRRADEGMQPIENEEQAASGALDHAGQHPAMQRSKFARQ